MSNHIVEEKAVADDMGTIQHCLNLSVLPHVVNYCAYVIHSTIDTVGEALHVNWLADLVPLVCKQTMTCHAAEFGQLLVNLDFFQRSIV